MNGKTFKPTSARKEEEAITIPEGTPTDAVLYYRERGHDSDTIIKGLQEQGYNSQQIYDAMNQADVKRQQVPTGMPGIPPPGAPLGPPGAPSTPLNPLEETEELVESVVEEKWTDVEEKLKPLLQWKEEAQRKIASLEAEVKGLKDSYQKLHEGVLGKIGEYDTNLQEVGSSIKAMDQVFKKVLPELTESVNKLQRMSE